MTGRVRVEVSTQRAQSRGGAKAASRPGHRMSNEAISHPSIPVEQGVVSGATGSQSAPRGRLFRKYVLFFVGLVGVALLVNGGVDFWFGYQENKEALIRVQQEKADAAAQHIQEFV